MRRFHGWAGMEFSSSGVAEGEAAALGEEGVLGSPARGADPAASLEHRRRRVEPQLSVGKEKL